MAVDISVNFCGVKFKNPFILSPSPASRAEILGRAAKAGWGGATTWTAVTMGEVVQEFSFSLPHEVKFIDNPPAYWAYQTAGDIAKGFTIDAPRATARVERLVRKAKESGLPIIANVLGSLDFDPWVARCVAAEKAGADILEVNMSYAIQPGIGMHLGFHRDLDKARGIVRAVREKTSIPITVKLNAFLIPQEIRDWAKACVEAGADAITITNSMPGMIGVDVETGLPLTTVRDVTGRLRGMVTIVGGPGTKHISLAATALVDSAVDVPIAAIGGVSDWYSAVEHMMLGASLVEVASAAMAYGHGMVRGMIRGLEEFMERHGYERVEDFVGLTSKKYHVGEVRTTCAPADEQPRKNVVDETKCNGCGKCMVACRDGAHEAITIEDRIAKINQEICWKCNLCILVCPEEAISTQWEAGILGK